jgi:hypothetical protein
MGALGAYQYPLADHLFQRGATKMFMASLTECLIGVVVLVVCSTLLRYVANDAREVAQRRAGELVSAAARSFMNAA